MDNSAIENEIWAITQQIEALRADLSSSLNMHNNNQKEIIKALDRIAQSIR